MTSTDLPEVWLRGPIEGYEPLLMPAVHALLQVGEDIDRLAAIIPVEHVWLRPGGAASIGFHIRHAAGALDRLFTYARGEMLSDEQKAFLRAEALPGDPPASFAAVSMAARSTIARALEQLRQTEVGSLLQERRVGRAGLPSNTLGLLFHGAEHATRHLGQAITMSRVLTAS